MSIYLIHCDYFRRRLTKFLAKECPEPFELVSAVTSLRTAFTLTEEFLEAYYPRWLSGWFELVRYRVIVEDEGVESASEVLSRYHSSQNSGEQVSEGSMNICVPEISSEAQTG